MGQYLILGSLPGGVDATLLATEYPPGPGRGPLISILLLIALAVLLSICSTVDAFVAFTFAANSRRVPSWLFLVYTANGGHQIHFHV